jgi:phosphatidate phosphatase APP1
MLPSSAAEVSSVKRGEAVVLFPSAAHLSADANQWVVPLHAWVYVPQQSQVRRTAIARLFKLRYRLDVGADSAPHFDRRINLLLANNKRGRRIVVEIEGTRTVLVPTAANGHARGELRFKATRAPGQRPCVGARVILPGDDPRRIETTIELVAPSGLSVISDIDDTVKITHVAEPRRMWEATFYRPFEPVPGMAEAYRRLAAAGASFHFVSSSPWHLAEPLAEFLRAAGFPEATLSLKHMRLKDRSVVDIARPGRETKPPAIEAILARFPGRRFVLIGDSGEDDPEIYADALRRHPGQIQRIYIRNAGGASRLDTRLAHAFAGLDRSRWALFDDPREIAA